MSGGSMDFLYQKVKDAEFNLNSPERIAFHKHLQKVSEALKAIEWNDSGDGDDDEMTLIREVIGDRVILESVLEVAEKAIGNLIKRVALLRKEINRKN